MSLHSVHAESPNQGIFKGPFRNLAVLSPADPISNDFPIPAVHNGDHMTPTSILTEKVCHVRGPSVVGKSV